MKIVNLKYSLLVILSLLLFLKLKPQNYIKTEQVNIELFSLKINNDDFLLTLDSIILNKNIKECDLGYVYLMEIEEDSNNCYVDVVLIKSSILNDPQNIGFFRRNNYLFVLQGDNPKGLYTKTDRKESFSFYRRTMQVGEKTIDYDSLMPEEFPSWFFYYSEGKLELIDTERVLE